MIEWTMTIKGKADDISEVPKDAQIDAVAGIPCLGRCEECGQPVLEHQNPLHDPESDAVMHADCDMNEDESDSPHSTGYWEIDEALKDNAGFKD